MHPRRQCRHCLYWLILVCAGVAWLSPVLPALAHPSLASPGSARLPRSERFETVTAAAQHCPGDTVVWSTFSKSRVFHLSASKYYGRTRHGAYACEKDALAAGYHASKR